LRLAPGRYGSQGPQAELNLFEEVVEDELPWLAQHLGALGLSVQGVCTEWLLCLFTTTLPAAALLRLWDLIILATAGVRASQLPLAVMIARTPSPPQAKGQQRGAGALAEGDGVGANAADAPVQRTRSASFGAGAAVGTHCVMLVAITILERSRSAIMATTSPYDASDAVKHAALVCYGAEDLLRAAARRLGGRTDLWAADHPLAQRIEHQRRRVLLQVRWQASLPPSLPPPFHVVCPASLPSPQMWSAHHPPTHSSTPAHSPARSPAAGSQWPAWKPVRV